MQFRWHAASSAIAGRGESKPATILALRASRNVCVDLVQIRIAAQTIARPRIMHIRRQSHAVALTQLTARAKRESRSSERIRNDALQSVSSCTSVVHSGTGSEGWSLALCAIVDQSQLQYAAEHVRALQQRRQSAHEDDLACAADGNQ